MITKDGINKRCSKCHEIKLVELFGKSKWQKDGLNHRCKTCVNKDSLERYYDANSGYRESQFKSRVRNRDKINQRSREFYQRNIETESVRRKDYYQDNKEWYSNWHKYDWINNREKYLARAKEYHAANRDKINVRKSLYRKINKERILMRDAVWRSNNRVEIKLARDKYKKSFKGKLATAAYKNRKIGAKPSNKLLRVTTSNLQLLLNVYKYQCFWCTAAWEHFDHVMPLIKGGAHSIDNLVPSCAKCNLSKHDKFPEEWALEQGINLELFIQNKEKLIQLLEQEQMKQQQEQLNQQGQNPTVDSTTNTFSGKPAQNEPKYTNHAGFNQNTPGAVS